MSPNQSDLENDRRQASHRFIAMYACIGAIGWLLVLILYQLSCLVRAVEIIANKMP